MEEEGKITDPPKPRRSESFFETALWQWQSGPNPDPWAEKDPTKWSWQEYSHDDAVIIEEAFSLHKEMADLGNYEIDFKTMLQADKQFKNRVRRVRRQEKSRFMMEMPEPVAVTKEQKTMNLAFGTIQHFLDYIMKRTPEAYGLYQRLKTLSLDSKDHEFEDIVNEVIACIEKGAETREKVVKSRDGPQAADFIDEARKIIEIIKENSTVLGDFLMAILRVYTMETFVCYWLNELLRCENWEEINVLTPFLVCLVYTFKRSEYIIKYKEPQGLMNNLFGFIGKQKLYLYRGAALKREHLDLYNPDKIEYFSWNGVTSTSREKNVALNFTRASLRKAKSFNEAKVGVFFVIETEFTSSEDCEGMIDVFENSCSRYPDEQEVILAPGTVFQLIKTRLMEKDIYEVSLRVKRKFEATKEDIALLGSLQDQAILKDKAVVDGLPSQQSFRLLEMLKGNKLIRSIEVRNSGIEEHIMEEIENMRVTTNVRKEDVKLRNNVVVVSSLDVLAHYYLAENFGDIFMFNQVRFKDEGALKNKDLEIKDLCLSEKSLWTFRQNNQLKNLSGNMTSAGQIVNLELALPKMEGANCEWTEFLQCIRECKGLQSLQIKINRNYFMQREGFELLCTAIGSSKTLNKLDLRLSLSDKGLECSEKALESLCSIQNLSLNLQFSPKISNEGLNHFMSGLKSLLYLKRLSLSFEGCIEISDEGLDYLKNALGPLPSLQNLALSFSQCKSISDKGLNHLKGGLQSLTSLQHLSLDFSRCSGISSEGLIHLKNGFISLTSLQHLDLIFVGCERIYDRGLIYLNGGLPSLASLQHLTLNCYECKWISDQGLNPLTSGLKPLINLQHLSLNFNACKKITDEGLNLLKSSLLLLKSLQRLSLDFSKCNKISDVSLNHLKDALISLTSLQDLTLDFNECDSISDKGLNHIKLSLKSLVFLQSLTLNFHTCPKVFGEGQNHLSSALTSLQHLSLDFSLCNNISDQGLNHLKDDLISHPSLQNLSLNFAQCKNISDKGLSHLKEGLVSLVFLQDLSLTFLSCAKISDEGLNHLNGGLVSLLSLQSFTLNLRRCNKVSDEGVNHLKSGLMSLTSLQHMYLNFSECPKISDIGLNHIKNALKSRKTLQDLTLYFVDCHKVSNEVLDQYRSELMFVGNIHCKKTWS